MSEPSKKLASLMKRLRSRFPDAQPVACPGAGPALLVDELIYSMLLWEASAAQAHGARERLAKAFVDANDLRVGTPDDIGAALGDRYPLASERSHRLRTALNVVYKRQHDMDLQSLHQAGKREARAYLESIDGLPLFAAARVSLVGLGAHALPVDDRLLALLVDAGVVGEDAGVHEASSSLERQVRAGEALATGTLLQAWSDKDGQPPRREQLAPTLAGTEATRASPKAEAAPARRARKRSRTEE